MNVNFTQDQLNQLENFIADGMGLYFPRARWDDLQRHAKAAAKELGFTEPAAFVQWVLNTPLSREQTETLAVYLTISETYFWREPQVFEALQETILPELIRSRESNNQNLRIWSAGCSTGEEAYSIAILLKKLIPNRTNWNITILATDINPNNLHRAELGVYGDWSFRNTPPDFREQYFNRTAQNKFEILPEIRNMVTFGYKNLVEDNFPSPNSNTNAMDIIFCRNVLMYFTNEHAMSCGQRFYQSLVDGGWLVVGASELSQTLFSAFSHVRFPGAILYRKENNKQQAENNLRFIQESQPLPQIPSPSPIPSPARKPLPQVAVHRKQAPQPSKITLDSSLAIDVTHQARLLANQGKLDEALQVCETAIASNKLNTGLYYLSASILQEQNRELEAKAALKQVLYLDPTFVLAYFALGNLALRNGTPKEAKKNFKNALSILEKKSPDDILTEAEGLTVGRLVEIIRTNLELGASTL